MKDATFLRHVAHLIQEARTDEDFGLDQLESSLHELAHAYLLGLDLQNFPISGVEKRVCAVIEARYKRPQDADNHEIQTFALTRRVLAHALPDWDPGAVAPLWMLRDALQSPSALQRLEDRLDRALGMKKIAKVEGLLWGLLSKAYEVEFGEPLS